MAANANPGVLKQPITDEDHVLGPPDAPLEVIEYGDYQCPHCGKVHPTVRELLARYGPRVRFAFRHFPLVKFHPKAKLAAEAAEAAAAEGKFWEMHDLLYSHQNALEPADLLKYAEQLGMDLDRFRRDLEAHVHAARVQRDLAGGVRSGVNRTPTFFINGRRHDGGYSAEELAAALDAAAGAGRVVE
jgi:protein-disulfide isomerase